MFAKLTALVGGGTSFPYNLEDPYASSWGCWTHYRGSSKEDNKPFSVFKISAPESSNKIEAARNGVKRLKLMRHPNILAFKDSIEVPGKDETSIFIVTEAVKPLIKVLGELGLEGSHRSEYVAMGLRQISSAVSFLNNDCKLIHGNVCLAAVVVTEQLDWKLHGLDLLSEAALPPGFALHHATWMVGNQYKPGELGRSEWDTVKASPPWAIDSWGMGCLVQEVSRGQGMQKAEELRMTDAIPPPLFKDYQRLLGTQPSRRLNSSKLMENVFLNNKLVEVVAFMESISVKDGSEKDVFFKRLSTNLGAIPQAVCVQKILPLLSSALEYGGAPASAIASLLIIAKDMDSAEFNKKVVPCLSKLFASPERGLRRQLLESIDQYAQHLSSDVLEAQIFSHLVTGFGDTNAYIRELTLKAMLSLAPKLSQKTLTQSVLKHLSKLQIDEEPSIRANTTVLLSNIPQYLGEATSKKVLVNAFTRALKDSFPPSRIAGLRALVATKAYISPEEAANRVLPSAGPLCVDHVPDVRQAALCCIKAFADFLSENDVRLTERAQEQTAERPAAAASAGSGMLGWAVSGWLTSTTAKQGQATAPPSSASSASGHTQGDKGYGPSTNAAPAANGVARAPQIAKTPSIHKQGSSTDWRTGDGWDEDTELILDESEQSSATALYTNPSDGHLRLQAANQGASVAQTKVQENNDDDDEWSDMYETNAKEVKVIRPSNASERRPSRSKGQTATATRKGGAMKLGASKLGASKLVLDLD